jgi:hypothetical protein
LVPTDTTTGTGLFINNSFVNILVHEWLSVDVDAYSAWTNLIKLIGEDCGCAMLGLAFDGKRNGDTTHMTPHTDWGHGLR